MSYKHGETIGDKIKRLRTEKGYTQDYVAEKAGISQAGYFRLEANKFKRQPNEILEKVAIVLGTTVEYLTSITGELDHLPEYLKEFVRDPANKEIIDKFYIMFKYEQLKSSKRLPII